LQAFIVLKYLHALGYGSNKTTPLLKSKTVIEINRGETSASRPSTSDQKKSVLENHQSSANYRSGSINSSTCVTPTMVTEDTDSEGMYKAGGFELANLRGNASLANKPGKTGRNFTPVFFKCII